MGTKSELFSRAGSAANERPKHAILVQNARNLAEIAAAFLLILCAIWTRQGILNMVFTVAANGCVLAFAILGKFTTRQMGLTKPLNGYAYILLAGVLACGAIAGTGMIFRTEGPTYGVPLARSWQYAVWALEQEFILQSIFFVRLEDAFGSGRAVLATAALFALVHIPNPVLVPLAFLGGIVFCEMFRRWRNLYPLGIIHAGLGLTIAASFPDKWLHHMRVGVGYWLLRS